MEAVSQPGVYGIIGRRGMGKDVLRTFFSLQRHQAGSRVVHNGDLYFGERFNINEIVRLRDDMQDATISVTEAQLVMPRVRAASTSNQMLASMLEMIRKVNGTFIYSSQFEHRIDSTLLDQTDVMYEVETVNHGKTVYWQATDYNWQWSANPSALQRRQGYDTRNRAWGWLRDGQDMFKHYNTDFVVDATEVLGVTSESIREQIKQQTQAIDTEWLLERIDEIREAGLDWVSPLRLVVYFKKKFDRDLTKEAIGRALTDLGYPKTRRSDGAWYQTSIPTGEMDLMELLKA